MVDNDNLKQETSANYHYNKNWFLEILTTGKNVALWKPTHQSSTYHSEQGVFFTSDKAVDGSGDGNFNVGLTCTHTAGQSKATWDVNLGEAYSIIAIKIANRNNNRKYATHLFFILPVQVYDFGPTSYY